MVALTQKAKYALKALAHLARAYPEDGAPPQPVLGARIAEGETIPPKFLEGILADLKRHGYLQSRKGRGGGYWLSRPPEQIHLGAVIRIFEGPLAPIPCVSKRYYAPCPDCANEADCEVRRTMLDVKKAILGVLDRTSLRQMVERAGEPIEL
ncbi:MAG: Rrf2 family transcriptional regulator [Trueperaceae bacterium]|nr:Rrf2 family transcriptional regulator [Trueperaceae bacterium]